MVNRVILLVLGAVVLASMAVGGLIGAQFADGDPSSASADGEPTGTPTATETPEPTATPVSTARRTPVSTQTAAPTPTSASTPTPAPTPFDPASVNATAVEAHVLSIVNDPVRDRAAREPLVRGARLDEMAGFHSDNMVRQGYPAHDAAGYSTRERYEEFGQYTRCRVPSDGNAGVRKGEEIELVGRITLDRGTAPDERRIADRIVAEWRDDSAEKRKLLYENADRVGIGASVTGEARVYVTVDLC